MDLHAFKVRILFAAVVPAVFAIGAVCADAQTTAASDEPVQLTPFEVQASSGYSASETASGTRIRADVQQLPFEVNIVTNDFLEDFAAFDDYRDEFAYVSGISTGGNYNQAYFVRGFQNDSQLRDGFDRPGMLDPVNVDRIEVIEGPEAAIYGISAPGGTINVVSKQPTASPTGDLILRGGGQSFGRVEVSASGPVPFLGSSGIFYRVDYATEHTDFGFAHNGQDTQELSAVLEKKWNSGATLEINADKDYTHHFGGDPQLLLETNAQGVSSYAYQLGSFTTVPKSAYTDRELQQVTLRFEDQLNRWMHLRLQGYYQTRTLEQLAITEGTYVPATNMVTGLGNPQFQWNPDRDNGLQGDLLIEFDTGPVSHSLLLGFDYLYTTATQDKYNMTKAALANPLYENVTAESVVDPNFILYTNVSPTNLGPYSSIKGSTGTSDRTQAGFASERMFFDDKRLTILATVRDNFLLHEDTINYVGGATTGIRYDPSITYETGLNYAVTPAISLYGDWATSFVLNTGLDINGNTFQNETGAGWEAGAKGNWQDGKYTFTADIFNDNRTHVLEQDPLNTAYNIDSGSQNSHGAEFDFFFRPTRQWTIFGQATRLDTTYTQNTSAPYEVGVQVFEVPPFDASVATRYDFGSTRDHGFYATLGLRYIGSVNTKDQATAETYLFLPSYYQLDGSLGYGWKKGKWLNRIVVNLNNLTDQTSYVGKAVLNPGFRAIVSYELYFK